MNTKLIIGIVAVVIVVILIIAGMSVSKPSTAPVSTTSPVSSTTQSSVTSTTQPLTTTSVTPSSPFLVKVINVTNAQAVAEEDGYQTKAYLVVYLNITYLGSGTITLHTSNFDLYTTEGIYSSCEFEPPGISGYLENGVTLQHGNYIVGGIAFLVPSSAVPQRLVYTSLLGQTYFNISLPKPNSYISYITTVSCQSTDSLVLVSSSSPLANIEGFNGQAFNITLEIQNGHFSTPVTIEGISLSPQFKYTVDTNYKGVVINPGDTYYLTITIYFPNESYYGPLTITVDVS
ncbi:hypothetical protein SJAV_08680 [Sulfurisphaera javensis]|uniref:DUF4352 domain-containing protein n=1 Tax=Sulfurisphaera javensis TaxID=2049879 RepID=A0AAT9GQF3_9CREN